MFTKHSLCRSVIRRVFLKRWPAFFARFNANTTTIQSDRRTRGLHQNGSNSYFTRRTRHRLYSALYRRVRASWSAFDNNATSSRKFTSNSWLLFASCLITLFAVFDRHLSAIYYHQHYVQYWLDLRTFSDHTCIFTLILRYSLLVRFSSQPKFYDHCMKCQ